MNIVFRGKTLNIITFMLSNSSLNIIGKTNIKSSTHDMDLCVTAFQNLLTQLSKEKP